jgi:hypothetical protein
MLFSAYISGLLAKLRCLDLAHQSRILEALWQYLTPIYR